MIGPGREEKNLRFLLSRKEPIGSINFEGYFRAGEGGKARREQNNLLLSSRTSLLSRSDISPSNKVHLLVPLLENINYPVVVSVCPGSENFPGNQPALRGRHL